MSMSDAAFDRWAAGLIIVGDEAFTPEEVDGQAFPTNERPVKRCKKCGGLYLRNGYSAHVDQAHTNPRRIATREWMRKRR